MTTRIKFYVSNGSNVEGASVYCWFYNSNNSLYRCSGLTETQNNETCFVIESENAFNNSVYYIVHAYYNGASNIDSSHKTFVNGTNNIETIKLNNSNGYFFNLTSFSNFDTLFYYIGANQPVFPIKLIIANSNNTQITSVTLNNENSFTPITGYCNTQDIFLKTVPTGLTYNYFDSAITSLNIFGYIGGNISVNALTPKKQYEIEMPFVYDTAFYDNFNNTNIPCYNLPNTNIDLEFHTWNYTMEYEQTTNSNINSITIINTDVYSENVNNNWFYRCLAGNNISEYNSVKYKLSKNHYDDKQLSLTLSAYPLNDYENSCSTINHLYFCLNDTSVNPILLYSKEMNVITIDREKDAVFTRKELSDYVSGFDFYNDDLHKQSGLLLMFIDEFPTESELTRDGIDFEDFYNGYTPQEFDLYVDDYLDNPVLYGGNLYMYLRETFNYNGTNYYIWKLINDNNSSSDNVRYILTDTINYTTLYQQSLEYNPYNTYNTPVIVFLDSDRDYYMERHNYTEKIVKVMQANYDSFVLTPQNKATPSKTDFYKEVCSKFCGAEIDNLIDFKSTFVDFLRSGNEFITTYTKENYLESHYTDDNKHCYVLEETFYPVSGEGGNYLYFKNKCKSPQITGYENINTTVGVTLSKYGNPSNINIEYSFNYNPWRPYTIGTKIYLPKTGIIFFRAVDTNATFSIDADNFYIFDIDNTLTNDECNVSYDDLLGQYTLLQTNYDVIVGGKISSLLISTTSENAILNSFGFYDLFGNIKITDASELNLDLLSIPSYGYKYMFHSTEYLKKGPKIAATSVNEYSMDNMFEYSSLTGLSDNNLYFTLPASHCCYCMFAESNYNTNLNIASSDGNGSSHFENMFFKCKGSNASVTFQNMTTFNTDACRRMFYSANTTVFCTFSNTISNIGQTAFYEMYRYSRITSVNFTVTGSVFSQGCMYMCANLNSNSCYISNMHLDAEKQSPECYSHMFYCSQGVNGNFEFIVSNVSESGCSYMFYSAGTSNTGITTNGTFDGIVQFKLGPMYISKCSYSYMFYSANIKKVPILPAYNFFWMGENNGADECYSHMFQYSQLSPNNSYSGFTNPYVEDVTGNTKGSEFVLQATILPDKCYEYMFANTKITRILYVITTGLTKTGFKSCSHMFDSTNINFKQRSRYLYRYNSNYPNDKTQYVTIKPLKQVTFAEGSTYDKFRFPGRTARLTEGIFVSEFHREIEILTAVTVRNTENSTWYNVRGYYNDTLNTDYISFCGNTLSYDLTTFNNGDCYLKQFDETSGIGNTRQWRFYESHKDSNSMTDFKKVYKDKREEHLFNIGEFSKYSYDDENTTYGSGDFKYRYNNFTRYVDLTATELGDYCYEYMFANCEKLYPGHGFRFPNLTTTSEGCFKGMFEHCVNLRSIQPSISSLTLSNNCFESMYSHCSRWDTKGHQIGIEICGDYHTKYYAELPSSNDGYVQHIFASGNSDDNQYTVNGDGGGIYIKDWNNRISIDFSKSLYDSCFKTMFSDCISIISPKMKLQQTSLASNCYAGMFCGCTQMTSGLTLYTNQNETASEYCFENMFRSCYNLKNGVCDNLHKNLESHCYDGMFAYCYSMSAAPYLPATTLSTKSYRQMFYRAIYADECWRVRYNFSGSGYVNASTTYSDNIRLKIHNCPDKVYFELETDGADTPRVKHDGNNSHSTGSVTSYTTYYTNERLTTNTELQNKGFQMDFLSGLTNMLSSDSVFGEYYKNYNDLIQEPGDAIKNYLVDGLPVSYPKCHFIHENLAQLINKIHNFIENEYYAINTFHREWHPFSFSPVVIVKITWRYRTQDTLPITETPGNKGIKYIKAALNSSETGVNKTEQWVYELNNLNGTFSEKNGTSLSYGENSIPNGWAITTFNA